MPPYLPWYAAGPVFGLCVAALYLVNNQRLGVSGSYLHITKLVLRRPGAQAWRVWFFGGLLLGAAGAALGVGDFAAGGYGDLAQVLSPAAIAPTLLGAGVLIGYGARYAGGCTSGHGLAGCSSLSSGSMVTSLTFFGTAIAVTWLLHLATGGAL